MSSDLDGIADALLRIAEGDFCARIERSYDGEPFDVVACLINNMAQELAALFDRQAQARRELDEAARLAAVGRLAAGVAHELNNPLAHLSLGLEYLGGGGSLGPDEEEVLRGCLDGVERMARVVGDLKDLGRPHNAVSVSVPVDVEEVVRIAAAVAASTTRHLARVEVQPGAELWVLADRARLIQAIVNLLVNASEAYAAPDPARNVVRLSAVERAGFVLLAVTDQAGGVQVEPAERVFAPFVTSKGETGGSGLGLTLSRGLVEAMGGQLHLESTPGVGCVFTIELPAASSDSAAVARTEDAAPLPAAPRRPRVLIVDDEPEMRVALRRLLRRDCDIFEAGDGDEALAALGEGTFDLVLCDLVMPGMDGVELLARARDQHGWLDGRWVVMTGGAVTAAGERSLRDSGVRVLDKPFRARAVRELISQSGLNERDI